MRKRKQIYAIKGLQYTLCNPKGVPLSLHTNFDDALETFTKGHIVKKDWRSRFIYNSRQAYFDLLLRKRYSIRKCYAWVRMGPAAITKLPPERKRRSK